MRCPLRFKEFATEDDHQECQPDCAWALAMTCGGIDEGFDTSLRCSIAVIGRALNDQVPESAFMTMPFITLEGK